MDYGINSSVNSDLLEEENFKNREGKVETVKPKRNKEFDIQDNNSSSRRSGLEQAIDEMDFSGESSDSNETFNKERDYGRPVQRQSSKTSSKG